jgi:uncharacterized protein YehS (DUF1456 family)
MTCNDILNRLRYILDYGDATMVSVFAAADHAVTEDQIRNWTAAEDDPRHAKLADRELALFLNGLINHRRGKRPGPQPVPENRLNNNLIATKLKIALDLKGEDMIRILKLGECHISNHELSAFFRKPGHTHYRKLNDQILRKFLKGLQLEYRPTGQ